MISGLTSRWWAISPTGVRRTSRPAPVAAAQRLFPLSQGGWLATLDRPSPTTYERVGTVDERGRARELRVAGGPVTPQRLHDALGLAAKDRPPLPDPDFGPPQYGVSVLGYEQATDSAVVFYETTSDGVVARVPVGRGAPALIERIEDPPEYVTW